MSLWKGEILIKKINLSVEWVEERPFQPNTTSDPKHKEIEAVLTTWRIHKFLPN
ncbi:MAG: hypothetical protein WAM60_23090 [Candidatus Promineifilaceae bacterium]